MVLQWWGSDFKDTHRKDPPHSIETAMSLELVRRKALTVARAMRLSQVA